MSTASSVSPKMATPRKPTKIRVKLGDFLAELRGATRTLYVPRVFWTWDYFRRHRYMHLRLGEANWRTYSEVE